MTASRWRDDPRRPLLRSPRYFAYPPLLAGFGWWGAVAYAIDAIAGTHYLRRDLARWQFAQRGLGSLVVAVSMTWLTVLYLRKPVEKVRRSTGSPHY